MEERVEDGWKGGEREKKGLLRAREDEVETEKELGKAGRGRGRLQRGGKKGGGSVNAGREMGENGFGERWRQVGGGLHHGLTDRGLPDRREEGNFVANSGVQRQKTRNGGRAEG